MPGWIENRLYALEQRVEALLRQVQDLIPQLRSAAQTARNAFATAQPGSGGSIGVSFFCLPTALGAATGSWPALTPGSQSLTVYQVAGTVITSVGTFTVYNWYPAAAVASKVLMVAPDGAGAFVAVAQSCT